MAKLFFRYGTMGSGKSMDLLKVAYNYEENGLKSLILTSKVDNRYGMDKIQSRSGLKREAIGIGKDDNIYDIIEYKKTLFGSKMACVLVDEVQFFEEHHIQELLDIVDTLNIPVICYGLRSDFQLQPFGTSKILMAVADELEELKTICSHCKKKKALVNARINENGNVVTDGVQIDIGGNDKYKPLCRRCFKLLKNN